MPEGNITIQEVTQAYYALLTQKMGWLAEDDFNKVKDLLRTTPENEADKFKAFRDINWHIIRGKQLPIDAEAREPNAVDDYIKLYSDIDNFRNNAYKKHRTGEQPFQPHENNKIDNTTQRIITDSKLSQIIHDVKSRITNDAFVDNALEVLDPLMEELYTREALAVESSLRGTGMSPPRNEAPEPWVAPGSEPSAPPSETPPAYGTPRPFREEPSAAPPPADYAPAPAQVPQPPSRSAPIDPEAPATPEPVTLGEIDLQAHRTKLDTAIEEKLPRIPAAELQKIRTALKENSSKNAASLSPQERCKNVLNALQNADEAILEAETKGLGIRGRGNETHNRTLHGGEILKLRETLWSEVEKLQKDIVTDDIFLPATAEKLLNDSTKKKPNPLVTAGVVYSAYGEIGRFLSPYRPAPQQAPAPAPAPAPQAPGVQHVAGAAPPPPTPPAGPGGQASPPAPPTPPGGNGPHNPTPPDQPGKGGGTPPSDGPDDPGKGGGDDGKEPPSGDKDKGDDGKGKNKIIMAVIGVACVALGALGIKALRNKNQEPQPPQQAMGGGYGR